jgi:predicted anti-sigma-YlaC factor YlaD
MTRVAVIAIALSLTACSVRRMAVRSLGDALGGSQAAYGRDDDPELVRDASPFTLKTIESLLEVSPSHQGLLDAASSGFARYAYAFVQQEADLAEERDLARATALRERTRRLYLRARDYGFRRLEADIPGFRERLPHARALYWTAFAWTGAMSLAKDDPELTADQGQAESMMRRALALDEGLGQGAVHDFFIAWEGGRSAVGGSWLEAREHLERSLALGQGRRVAPLVIYAESVCVARQDRAEFERLLKQALELDPDRTGDLRLENLIQQRRARWLLGRADLLFIE